MIERPEGPLRTEVLTWTDVDRLVDILTPQIRAAGSFTAMILITRGGVIPGGMLAEALQIEHLLTAAVDFPSTAAGLMVWPSFLQFPDDSLIRGRRTLIVDDVWGSGRTSISVRERVETAGGIPFTCVLHFIIHYKTFQYLPGTIGESVKVTGGFLLGLPHTAEYFGPLTFFGAAGLSAGSSLVMA